MKQKFLLKAMLLLCALIVGSSSVWAAEESYTATSSDKPTATNGTTSGSVTGTNSISWSYSVTQETKSGKSPYVSHSDGSGWQLGSGNSPCKAFSISTSGISGTITQIQVVTGSAGASSSINVTVGGAAFGTQGQATGSGSTVSTQTFTGSASGNIVISASASTGAFYFKSVTVTYTPSGGGSDPSISLDPNSIKATKAEKEGTITVTYDNIASVDAEVKFYQADGTTPETYSWIDADINSTTKNVDYLIDANTGSARTAYMKVLEKTENVYSELITITQESGIDTPTFDPAAGTYTTAQNVTISCATDGATIYYTTDGSDPDDGSSVYSAAEPITISGTVIKAIAYKAGGHSEIASAKYTIKPNKPTVTAVGATVTITGDDGLDFYYTTDGTTTPTKASTKYTGSFDLLSDCNIKARAYDAYNNASDVYSFTFKYMPLEPKNINSGYFVKVTNVSDLENGDAILIVNETANVAMSTDQKTNNRGQADVTITNDAINNPSVDVQKLVLVKTTEEINSVDTEVFYFYTGSGYLYAASNTSNYLKTETTPDNKNNARATIAISAGDATILFTGDNSRKWLKYNSLNSLFSCYATDDAPQSIVQIYKEIAHSETLTPGKTYTTLTSAYNLDFTRVSSDLEAYIATVVSGGSVKMTQVSKVPANTGLVLKATTPGSAVNVPVFDGTGAEDVSANKMAGSATQTTAVAENGGYILKDGVFQPALAGTLAAGKAYLAISASAPFLSLDFGNEATNIADVRSKMEDVKGEVYNLNGQRVAQPTKGLYIVNGRKVVIK